MIPVRRVVLGEHLPVDYRIDRYFAECHNHEYYEFICVVRGRGINVINDTIQFFEPKTMALIRPEDVHYVKKIEEFNEKFEYFNIPVPVDFMEAQFKWCEEFKSDVLTPKIPRQVVVSNTEIGVLSARVLNLATMEYSDKRKYLYYQLLHQLCGIMLANEALVGKMMPKWFSDLLVEIENIEPSKLDYNEVLKTIHVSGKSLWKAFKKYLNTSPNEYIAQKRAAAGYGLIVNTDKSLMDIAMELNYGSYVQFYREIKRKYNMSPNEIRKG